ncbi:MAG: tetratricopeptide repeat protein [Verrucomicrobiia bacterium]
MATCALVIGIYISAARSGTIESLAPSAAETYYNLLVRGFRDGHLSLKKEVPLGLMRLADTYDPIAMAPYLSASYQLFDLSCYKGRLYLYFGVTPVLILFWPFVAVTDHYLFHKQAVVIFCSLGFLVSVGLLLGMWRRYFSEVSTGVVAACALALGLATGVPLLLPGINVYEVAISCGYMLTMLALVAIWYALHEPQRRCRWLVAASLVYGLALGARPSLLFGAAILLVPVAQTWRERRPVWTTLIAATVPIILIGLGLMLYNALRFNDPFEFGMRYQLTTERLGTAQHFSLGYLWFNFRVYFLKSVGWSRHFPFVENMVALPPPAGHGGVEQPFGILTNIPLVWMSLVVPLAWRNRSSVASNTLRWFLTAVVLLFGIGALTLGLYYLICSRFEVEFLPPLVLLAVVGVLGLERALTGRAIWQRTVVRWAWCLLLSFSVIFSLLATIDHQAEINFNTGLHLVQAGRVQEAIGRFEQTLRVKPKYAEVHNVLGVALGRVGRTGDAIEHFEQALRIKPDLVDAHNNLGNVLFGAGKVGEAMAHFKQALQIKPDCVEAHCGLGVTLAQGGRFEEAIDHYDQALRIKPDSAVAHGNLGVALFRLDRVQEAIGHYEQALRIRADIPEVHYSLGLALEQAGRIQEAIRHYEQAIQIKPDFVEAQRRLTQLRSAP